MQTDKGDQPLWYAIQVKARMEGLTGELLKFKGYEVFLPQNGAGQVVLRKKPASNKPLFPGYLFLNVRPHAAGLVVTTPGVIRIVGAGTQPVPIDAAEIDAIRVATLSSLDCTSHRYLASGERVEIHHGALSGVSGIMLRNTTPNKVLLSVGLIGASIAVNLD